MTNEELVLEYKETKSNKVFKNIVDKNIGLISKIARSFSRCEEDIQDLTQEGLIAIEKAACHFDATKNLKFSTLATFAVRNRLTSFCEIYYNPLSVPLKEEAKELKSRSPSLCLAQDLDYALGTLKKWQREAVVKTFFSKTFTKSDKTISDRVLFNGTLRKRLQE